MSQVGDGDSAAARSAEIRRAKADALVAVLEAHDGYTGMHSRAVVEVASAVATALGLRPCEVEDAEHVALLHDVGKIAIPDAILQKPTQLDEAEWEAMRRHPAHGERVVTFVPELEYLSEAIRAEHERWDGNGYPDGLAGAEIPEASRIVSVCDAYHAMRSDRPYRDAIPPAEAEAEISDNLGTQFCPDAGRALLDLLEERVSI